MAPSTNRTGVLAYVLDNYVLLFVGAATASES